MPNLDWLTAHPVAHRGLHDARLGVIENTPTAFRAAIAANYAIECDLQITADGEAMVSHDDDLGRLTEGSGALATMPAADLKRVPFKATADHMLALGELCDLVAGRVTLLIELKSHGDGDGRVATRAAAILADYHGPCAVMSFDPLLVQIFGAAAPKMPRGMAAERRRTEGGRAADYIRHVIAARPQFLAYSVKDLPALLPFMARSVLGMPVLTWTVRSAEDRQTAGRWADQMIFEGFRP
jgi:glycerophosphoryl diester phosphodiesterase